MSGDGWSVDAALASVSSAPTINERIDIVKHAVARQIETLTHRSEVRFTDYFNHTYTPDMIIRDRAGRWSRELFIRLSSSPDQLIALLPRTAAPRPMIVPVEAFDPDSQRSPSWTELGDAATDTGSWVADTAALSRLAVAAADDPVNDLLGQSLVRGGQGLDSAATMTTKTGHVRSGFDAAKHADATGTAVALTTLAESLDDTERDRLTRVLRAVWLGSQGSAAAFPSAATLGAMTTEDLDYLIASLSDSDEDFWRTIGRGLHAVQLTELSRPSVESPHFQSVVAGALPWLRTKAMYARVGDPNVLGERDHVRWTVQSGCLAVHGPHWTCYLASSRKDELPIPNAPRPPDLDEAPRHPGIPWSEAIRRLGSANAQLLTAGWVNEQWVHTVTPRHQDAAKAISADEIGANPRTDRVTELTVKGEGVPTVTINFDEATASGATTTKFDTAPLLRLAIPMLIPLTAAEDSEVRDLLHTEGVGIVDGGEQLQLLD